MDSKLFNLYAAFRSPFQTFSIFSCFINNVGVFFGAFLGPIMLVLSFNMVIFVVVIVVLVRHFRKRSKDRGNKLGTLLLMANITCVAFLFGLTWLFGALTVFNLNNAFQILFTLANSFQGFIIFIFFCLLNSDVRLAWMHQLFRQRFSHQPKLSSTSKLTTLRRDGQDTSKECESVVTEDIMTLGRPAKLVRTWSRKGKHMNEVVELVFNDGGLGEGEASGDDVKLNTSKAIGQCESGV